MRTIKILSISIVILTAALILFTKVFRSKTAEPVHIAISDTEYSDSLRITQEQLMKERMFLLRSDSLQLKQKQKDIRNLGRIRVLESIESTSSGAGSSTQRLVTEEIHRYLNDSIQLEQQRRILAKEQALLDLRKQYEGQVQSSQKSVEEQKAEDRNFLVKLAFSIVFCIAGLFVVLSNKYDEGTKKWAFSVLTLIAGVWIGAAI